MRGFSPSRILGIALCLGATTASAQTGVSDDRVSLPDGPGSIEGLGDNVSVDGNMGAMAYSIPIELPQGYAGMTPELGLSYSSGGGNGLVGVGWSMRVPTIERLTLRGLPRYVADDEFAADGSEQLVRVSQTSSTAVYRARFERGFVRYTWHDAGEAGYWSAEYPDGRVGYFGATADGTIIPEARLESAAGETFRYFLVEMVDVHGHRVRYEYEKSGVTPLLSRIGWVFEGTSEPRYAVELEYEARPDPISDAQPGFEELLTERVWFVRVRSRGEAIRAYRLTYEDEATSGGFSRLAMVERLGRDGSVYPVVNRFGYSRSLGGVCGSGRCDRPFVVDMGTLDGAAGIATGDATLVDINGDALPDLVDSSMTGPHRFYDNVLDGDGRAHFEAARASATTPRSGFELNQAYVQVLDVNGDGFADLANARTAQIRCNGATGDWETTGCGALSEDGFTLEDDGVANDGDTDPVRTRFVDLNADRRIDLLRTNAGDNVQAWLNTGSGFTVLAGVDPIGRTFDSDRLQLADMNGDGLLDAVVVESGTVRYRLSLGFGRWAAWVTIDGPSIESDSAMNDTELQDLNGDGLDDLVIVQGSTVRYSLNRGAGRFDPFVAITSADVDGLPTRAPTTTVLFADMNGSGSQDAVWVEASGRVRFLELFPVRPNLISRLENGLGMVHAITYGTSVAHQAASESPWRYTLPHAMNVVDRTDTWVTLTGDEDGEGLHEVVEYGYRDGFYDGVEKAFRGFASVEQRMLAELSRDSQEPALTVQTFDVGATDPYYAGLPLSSAVFSGDEARPLSEERHAYADCEVAGVPSSGLRFDVRHVCEVETTRIAQEGQAEDAWVTTQTHMEHDGYGQVVRSENRGVVHHGSPESPSACGPCEATPSGLSSGACGESCTGDEMIETRAYVEPGSATGDRWILGRVHTMRRFAMDGGPATEEHTYYDGEDFIGLALGQLREGMPTRVTTRASESVVIESTRSAYDAHGNVVATLDPLGDPDDPSGHRRAYTYDSAGLRVVRAEIFVSSPMGEPYTLRQEYSYEPAFDKVIESSAWMVEGSPRNPTYYAYDEFARIVAIAKPGDTLAAPTLEVEWALSDPASRIVVHRRSEPGAAVDLTTVKCVDGRGRTFQERTRVAEGEWLANGFTEYNRRGAEVRVYQPHTGSSGDCALEPPSGVAFTTVQYDGAQREVRRTLPDAEIYGSASITRTVYEPLATLTFDANDNDPESPHADTPGVVRVDGLGRPVTVERLLRTDDGIERAATRLLYDSVGSLSGYVDALGNIKTQEVDLANRLVRVVDPNSGETRLTHDAAGNVIRRVDARGVATITEYDGANRPIARYDEASPEATRVTFQYDLADDCASCTNTAGQLVEASYPMPAELSAILGGAAGRDLLGYDARGRSVYSARVLGEARLETTSVFDGADRPIETIFPDGQRIVRRFDGASRLVAIDGLLERVEYDPRNLIARVLRADGSEDVMEHDALMRLARLTSTDAMGGAMQDYRYERDRHGQILAVDDRAALPEGFAQSDARYTYDAWYRVTGAELEPSTARAETLSWGYDAIDNTLSATSTLGGLSAAHVGDYAYERPGVASQAGGLSLVHDPAGYLTARGELALEWDYLGRLVSATRDGEARGVFAYGPDQNRVAKIEDGALTIYAGPDFELRDGVSRAYARIDRSRVARSQSTDLGVALYGDASGSGDVDAADAWLTRDETDRLSARHHAAARRLLHEAAPEPVQLFSDHLGSLGAATREGEVVGLRRYHPYGAIRAERGFVDERGFTGQELDASTGLLAFQWRYLDPHTGRWISADPAFESVGDDVARLFAGIGRYAYVGGNPVNAFDPLGLVDLLTVAKWSAIAITAAATIVALAVPPLAMAAGIVAAVAAVGTAIVDHYAGKEADAQLSEMSRNNATLVQQSEGLSQQLTGLRQQVADLSSQNAGLSRENGALGQQVSGLEASVSTLTQQNDRAQASLTELTGQSSTILAQNTTLLEQNTGLHARVAHLEGQVSTVASQGRANAMRGAMGLGAVVFGAVAAAANH